MPRLFRAPARRAIRFLLPDPRSLYAAWRIRRSGLFDRAFYRGAHPGIPPLFRLWPERHYVLFGEAANLRPNPRFDPAAYRSLNADLTRLAAPLLHYIRHGRAENRPAWQPAGAPPNRAALKVPVLRPAPEAPAPAPYAVVVHLHYPEVWDEIAQSIVASALAHDLFVTCSEQGAGTDALVAQITARFPHARVIRMPNHGRDIFPFVHLVNAGLLAPYRAVCKIHGKRSPHRRDGDRWRRALIDGLLPPAPQTADRLNRFLGDDSASLWVAEGQVYRDQRWWGDNAALTSGLLARVEIRPDPAALGFPAGSMYWLKPLTLSMIQGLQLTEDDFELESGKVDGTTAHAFERAMGFIATAGGQHIREAASLDRTPARPESTTGDAPPRITPPAYVSAFYLPQFHRTPQNDAWWGPGYTEWQAVTAARPQFPGHAQPALPQGLGFYDLTRTEVLGEQAALARRAGIDAFCCHHYWFDGTPLLDAPLQGLLDRPEVDFPFYLCWANESWRRNWDGLSGETLIAQTYPAGFEQALAASVTRYMRDPRYQRPDGTRPRFVIYRPGDMPDPAASVAALRQAWRDLGIGEVELGAVRFHLPGLSALPEDLFDFQIEMPPHGLVTPGDYLAGGPPRDLPPGTPRPCTAFRGLIYDYEAVIANALATDWNRPPNLIAGIMPSWDNTARRGRDAHIAHGANPAAFRRWLRGLACRRLAGSYRNELFVNAWNEWGERAAMEPSRQYGAALIDTMGDWRRAAERGGCSTWHG